MPPDKDKDEQEVRVHGPDEWARLGLVKRIDYENLRRVFERLDLNKDSKIDKDELEVQYRQLGYIPRRMTEYGLSEVEDIIWEVGSLNFLAITL